MNLLSRRKTLGLLFGGIIGASGLFLNALFGRSRLGEQKRKGNPAVLKITELPKSGPWPTADPFLFCVHHNDQYPAGDLNLGPKASLSGRDIGQDFSNRDGWSMYHGSRIPGFPRHPHRGFETLTVVKQGVIDHSDSLGARARYGDGDAQWLTAGNGVVHAEMFPLLEQAGENPMDFFQIWINLPAKNKRVDAHFTMFWDKQIPEVKSVDSLGRQTTVSVVAGQYEESNAPAPPPNSWASDRDNDVAVWRINMSPQASWELPKAGPKSLRSLYVVKGAGISLEESTIARGNRIEIRSGAALNIQNLDTDTELLLLQGKPIDEPVARYGPFVMNTQQEIQQAYDDYSQTQFGGWKWPDDGPVHGNEKKRFAQLIDGSLDEPS